MCNARYMAVYHPTPVLYPSSFKVSVFFDTGFGFYSARCEQCYLESLVVCLVFFPGRNIFSVNVNLVTQSEMFLFLCFYLSPANFQLLCILACRRHNGETKQVAFSLRLTYSFFFCCWVWMVHKVTRLEVLSNHEKWRSRHSCSFPSCAKTPPNWKMLSNSHRRCKQEIRW